MRTRTSDYEDWLMDHPLEEKEEPEMLAPEKITFGYKPPYSVPCYWGARAIYRGGKLDILHDRRTVKGPLPTGLIKLMQDSLKELEKEGMHPASQDTWTKFRDGYVFSASCKGSYGYMYLGCWPMKVIDDA